MYCIRPRSSWWHLGDLRLNQNGRDFAQIELAQGDVATAARVPVLLFARKSSSFKYCLPCLKYNIVRYGNSGVKVWQI